MSKWIQSFEVPSTTRNETYIVSLNAQGGFGCSCPQWKFRRGECKHIQKIKADVRQGPGPAHHSIPTCLPANVPEVRLRDSETLLVPLLQLGNHHFLATLVVDLLLHGIPFEDIRRRYHLPPHATRAHYIEYVLAHGRQIYGPIPIGEQQRPLVTTSDWILPEPLFPNESHDQYHRRTGCPLDLIPLALQRLPVETMDPNAPDTPGPSAQLPFRRQGERRITLASPLD